MENTEDLEKCFIELQHPGTGQKILYPKYFSQEDFESALRYKARPNDVFICSSPKCGSTWLQNIVWLILHHGKPIPGKLRQSIPMLEFDGCEHTEATIDGRSPHIIKTHFPYKVVPQHPDAKYLNIIRNPKDAVVSYYYHIQGLFSDEIPNIDFDELFNLYVKEKVEFNGYFNHVIEWYSKRDEPNVLFLLYEDLKTNTRSEILKIARFLGDDYEGLLLSNNEEILSKVLNQSSFKSMQKEGNKWLNSSFGPNGNFIRKGVIGDWKNHLSTEQSEIMDRLLNERGNESGLNLLWKNHLQI